MFEDGIQGTLMQINKSDQTRFGFVVWFPFMRSSMTKIREGSLIAVKNFSTDKQTIRYSVLRITLVLPNHYAMMTEKDGYPGFIEEAATNAAKDWEQESPMEDTTKIICDAIPSMIEIVVPNQMTNAYGSSPRIAPESNIPMPGETVRLLDTQWTRNIINEDIIKESTSTIELGTLINSKDVEILALWDSIIRTHFGVFAYTNAGKSNLLSTMIYKIFTRASSVKLVVYDLMGEYGALLIDVIYHNPKEACIVYLSEFAMPQSVLEFWRDPHNRVKLETAAKCIVNTTILPKKLKKYETRFYEPVRQLLSNGGIKIMSVDDNKTLRDLVKGYIDSMSWGESSALSKFLNHVRKYSNDQQVSVSNIEYMLKMIDGYDIGYANIIKAENARRDIVNMLESEKSKINATYRIDSKFKISMQEIEDTLNDCNKKTLYVIQGSDDEEVRYISKHIGDAILDTRRARGIISPAVSFIYDEADQFIAQDSDAQQGMKESKRTAEQIARRGRKYGLGVGIATQRIVYLDTNILGQPHTYLVSKLPRITDRERIQQAFGLSDDAMSETMRFGVGQWLLISHSATGMDGVPIPIQIEDANERIARFLVGVER